VLICRDNNTNPSGEKTMSSHLPAVGCAFALSAFALPSLAQDVERIATGLSNPRGLNFAANGALYVAENGRGGPGPCIPSPAAPPPAMRCYGETGSIARIDSHAPSGFTRVVTGLPSMVLPNGNAEGGPADISFHGMIAFVTMSIGGDPQLVRAALPAGGQLFGTMLRVRPNGRWEVFSDVAAHEVQFNPYGGPIDTNPYGLLAQAGRRVVADAGANALIEVRNHGRTRTLAVLGPVQPNNRDPVPTAVAEGPDGALYVSQLTGFPFFQGTSSVLRVESDGSSTEIYASGFTAAVDIAVDCDGALYVLETASGHVGPFPPPPPNPGLGAGRLVRQCPGAAPEVLLGSLTFPGGVALGPDGAVYLTNFGTSAAAGEVLKLTVAPCSD
jgi:sugar lactone lactonase YvrE